PPLKGRPRADGAPIPGRPATSPPHCPSSWVQLAAVPDTTATPISALRYSSVPPVSATATAGKRFRTSAMTGRRTDRFCFSDRTSPSSRSSVRAPTYTWPITSGSTEDGTAVVIRRVPGPPPPTPRPGPDGERDGLEKTDARLEDSPGAVSPD